MANKFDFNLISVKQAYALTAANKASSVPNAQALLEVSNELGAELVDRDLYDDALELTQAALRAASRAADKELIKQATEVLAARKHQNSAWQAYVKAAGTLDTNPIDAEANLAAGRWYASEAKDWTLALPCFEKCGNAALAAAAESDLKDPAKAEEIEAVADEWYRLGQQGGENVPLLMRASFWYQQLELIGSGLAKEKAVRRTREIENHVEIKAISKRAALLGVRNKPTPHVRSTTNAPTVQQRSTEAVSEEGKRNPFQESRDDGVLVGFDVTLAKFGRGYRGDSIGAIRPLFQTPTRLAEGNWHGTPKGEPIRVLAKPGFAVADLNASIGGRIMGMEIEFRRVLKGKLDSSVQYKSGWIGKQTDKVQSITADTRPWNGVFGSWRSDDAWPSSIVSLGLQSASSTIDQSALQQRLQSRFGHTVKAEGLTLWLDFENLVKRSGLAKQVWTCQAGSRIEFASNDLELVDAPDGSKVASLKGNGLRVLTPLLNGTSEYTFVTKVQISKDGECTLLCERTSDAGHIGEVWMNTNDDLFAMTLWSKNKRPDNWMRANVKLQEPIRNKWLSVGMRRHAQGDRIDVWIGPRRYETNCQGIVNDFPGFTVLGGKGALNIGETLFYKRALPDTEITALLGR